MSKLFLILSYILTPVKWLFSKLGSDHWERQGVPSEKYTFPFGNIWNQLFMRKTTGEFHRDIYRKYDGAPVCGYYSFGKPFLILKDPDVIKTVFTSNFSKFRNNHFTVSKQLDPLMYHNPLVAEDNEWKRVRTVQAPLQNTNYLKLVRHDVLKSTNNLVQFISHFTNKKIEAKFFATKYTGDTVTTCAFGTESNSFKNEKDFGEDAKEEVFGSGMLDNLAVLSAMLMPCVALILRLRVIRKELSDRFISMVKSTVDMRFNTHLKPNDYFQNLIEKCSKSGKGIDYTDMAAHCMAFYLDGCETSGLVLGWILWELGRNPDIQQTLKKEIQANGSRVEDFDDLSKLPYLDAVFSETLRLHPPIQSVIRKCTEDATLECTNGKTVKIMKGTGVVLPILALHSDEKYYPEPEKFNPLRFLQNFDKIPKYAYIPFSTGPRQCIGIKFANQQIKLALISILLHYTIISELNGDIKLDPFSTFLHTSENGLWIKFLPDC